MNWAGPRGACSARGPFPEDVYLRLSREARVQGWKSSWEEELHPAAGQTGSIFPLPDGPAPSNVKQL